MVPEWISELLQYAINTSEVDITTVCQQLKKEASQLNKISYEQFLELQRGNDANNYKKMLALFGFSDSELKDNGQIVFSLHPLDTYSKAYQGFLASQIDEQFIDAVNRYCENESNEIDGVEKRLWEARMSEVKEGLLKFSTHDVRASAASNDAMNG